MESDERSTGPADFEELVGGGEVVTATEPIIKVPPEIEVEVTTLAESSRQLVAIQNDEQLATVDAIRDRAGRVIKSIRGIYKDEKAARHKAHTDIVAEENAMLSTPSQIVTACTLLMKPYLQEQEIERLRQQRLLEAEVKNQDADRRRADADSIVDAAVDRAAELEREGRTEEARDLLDQVERDATEIITAPTSRTFVPAPPPAASALKKSSTSKTYKCNRQKANTPKNKLQGMKYAIAEAERGNWIPLSFFDWNFGNVDAIAKRQGEMFPAEDVCGLDVGLDLGIRSKRSTAGGGA